MALSEGLDMCLALSSITVAIGERFSKRNGTTNLKTLIKQPKAMARLLKGLVKK